MISADTLLERYKIIEQAIKEREHSRFNRDFERADQIKDALYKMDVRLLDSEKNGFTYWRFKDGA